MVQVLPYNPTHLERIVPAITEGLNTLASKTVLEQNLSQLQSAQNPKDLATALVRLQASHPGLDRSLGPLLSALSTSMQTALPETGGGAPQPGAGGGPSPVQQYTPKQRADRNAQEFSAPGRVTLPRSRIGGQPPEEQRIEPPQSPTEVQKPGINFQPQTLQQIPQEELYTPQQFKQVIEEGRVAGRDVTPTIANMEAHNARVIQQTGVENTNVATQQQQLKNQLELADTVYSNIEDKLPPSTDPNTKALYSQWVQDELPKHKDIAAAQSAVTKKIFDFDKTRQTILDSVPNNPFLGIPSNQAAKIHNSVKPILKTDPLAYNIFEAGIVKKGNSIFDAARILHPLNSETKSYVAGIPDFSEERKMSPLSARGMGGASLAIMKTQQAQQKQAAAIPEIADGLKKIWKSDTSLLNIYADLIQKSWLPDQITALLDRLEPLFNSQQQKERSQLNSPPPVPAGRLLK